MRKEFLVVKMRDFSPIGGGVIIIGGGNFI